MTCCTLERHVACRMFTTCFNIDEQCEQCQCEQWKTQKRMEQMRIQSIDDNNYSWCSSNIFCMLFHEQKEWGLCYSLCLGITTKLTWSGCDWSDHTVWSCMQKHISVYLIFLLSTLDVTVHQRVTHIVWKEKGWNERVMVLSSFPRLVFVHFSLFFFSHLKYPHDIAT